MYEQFFRAEVNGICILLLIWIIFRSKIINDNQTRNILFRRVIYSTLILIFADTACIFIDGRPGKVFYIANWILTTLYFMLNGTAAHSWFAYVVYSFHGNQKSTNTLTSLAEIPALLYATIAFFSFLTKMIFYIDPLTNHFIKGEFFILQILITYSFFTVSAFIAFFSIFSKKHKLFRNYVTVISFVALPLIGGSLHLLFPQARIIWQMLAVGFLLVYVEIQFDLISRDELTGLNNRRAFEHRLEKISEESFSETSGKFYHIFMIDINFFKTINDSYGHPEGDNALIKTAQILKKEFGKTNALISRYGGDEFAVIYYCSQEAAGNFRINLYKNFDNITKNIDTEYKLSISMGYAPIKTGGSVGIQKALKNADAELYKEKSFMHQAIEQLKIFPQKRKTPRII